MPVVHVTGRDGGAQALEGAAGTPLMEVLRDAGTGVDGTCGGMMSCGTCHVYVAAAWAAQLPARSADEQAMLEAIGELVPLQPASRLSCQIVLDDDLDGLAVEIAPAV